MRGHLTTHADRSPNQSGATLRQHSARPRNPENATHGSPARPSTGRHSDHTGGLLLSDDAHHRLQQLASVPRNKIHGVRRDWVFATKLLASATMTAHHLPHILGKLVCAGSLVASKRNRLWIASRSSVHAASLIHAHGCLPPHPQPFSPVSEDEHNSPPPTGEKGAILQKSPLQIAISTPRSIGHRAQLKFHAQARSWTNRQLAWPGEIEFGRVDRTSWDRCNLRDLEQCGNCGGMPRLLRRRTLLSHGHVLNLSDSSPV